MEPNLWIGNQPEPEDRLRITVSQQELIEVCSSRGRANVRHVVTDLNTGIRYRVRRTSCGLPNCVCALELVANLGQSDKPAHYATVLP
jgi:hypothetical protein